MRMCEVLTVVMACIGFVALVIPPEDITQFIEPILILCKVSVCVALLTFVPKLISLVKREGLMDILTTILFPFTVLVCIYILNPDVDTRTIEYVAIATVGMCVISGGLLKRYFVKKWGVEVNSYHPTEKTD